MPWVSNQGHASTENPSTCHVVVPHEDHIWEPPVYAHPGHPWPIVVPWRVNLGTSTRQENENKTRSLPKKLEWRYSFGCFIVKKKSKKAVLCRYSPLRSDSIFPKRLGNGSNLHLKAMTVSHLCRKRKCVYLTCNLLLHQTSTIHDIYTIPKTLNGTGLSTYM